MIYHNEYYNKKKEEGENKILILNNIRCKIIGRIIRSFF